MADKSTISNPTIPKPDTGPRMAPNTTQPTSSISIKSNRVTRNNLGTQLTSSINAKYGTTHYSTRTTKMVGTIAKVILILHLGVNPASSMKLPIINQISPNPNKLMTHNVEVKTTGISSYDCDLYHFSLTSQLYKVNLFLFDIIYALGLSRFNSTLFKQSIRLLNKECIPQVGKTWY